MHALDRLSGLLEHNNPWIQTVWQWSLGALGDQRQWNAQLAYSIQCLQTLQGHHKIRCVFNLIRGACCIGDMTCTTSLISDIEPLISAYPLLEWEIQRVKSMVSNMPPPVIGSLAYGLTAKKYYCSKNAGYGLKENIQIPLGINSHPYRSSL